MKDILRNIPKAEVLQLGSLVAYADGQVVSKTLVQNSGLGMKSLEEKKPAEKD